MKQLILSILIFVTTISGYGQALETYSDIISVDEHYEVLKTNPDELKKLDLSNFWKNNRYERILGFIGNNYQRLHMKFLSVIKNPEDSLAYLVYGKSMVSDNVCEFQGVIKIRESCYIKSSEYPDGNCGILAGEYVFYENPESYHSGIFKGRLVTYWYKDNKGNISYNDLWNMSALYNNNQFAGSWTIYGKTKGVEANWGDSRIPLSGDLDVGTSEFCPAEKYASNGWLVFMIANGASPDRLNIESAKQTESREWWNER